MAAGAITCPVCGLEELVDADGNPPPPLHEVGLFRCDGCGARLVHGRIVPRVVLEPHDGGRGVRWVRMRFQDVATKRDAHIADLDPEFAAHVVSNILDLVDLDSRTAIVLAKKILAKVT